MSDLHTHLAEVDVAIDQAHTQLLTKMISITKSESYEDEMHEDLNDLVRACQRHVATFNYLARNAVVIQQKLTNAKLIKRELNIICEDLTFHLPEGFQSHSDKK